MEGRRNSEFENKELSANFKTSLFLGECVFDLSLSFQNCLQMSPLILSSEVTNLDLCDQK